MEQKMEQKMKGRKQIRSGRVAADSSSTETDRKQSGGTAGRRRFSLKKIIVWTAAAAVLGVFAYLSSCSSTAEIKTAESSASEYVEGNSIGKTEKAGGESIAVMEKVNVLGTKQSIIVRGHDTDNPLLLWLSGGPGGSEVGWTREYLSGLEKDVIFVNWEQPGTGKSFRAGDMKEMTVQDFVDHTIALSELLIERFTKDSLILVGHSWGSIIGLMAADQRPDLFGAYVGLGQQVNAQENDMLGYKLVMEQASARGEDKIVKKLKENGPPPYTVEEKGKYTYLFQKLHVYSPQPPSAGHVNEMAMLFPQEYSLIDTVNLIRGVINGVNYIYPQLADLDFERDIPSLDVPVFFPTGRYDFTCVQDITYRYFQKLDAPLKKFYWMEHSGHNACYQEPELFMDIIRSDVLPLMDS